MYITKLNLLLVDDDITFVKPIEYYLSRQYSHFVTLANTMEMAQKILSAQKFDLIFLDYILPDGSGLDILRWLSENGIDTPCVMLTGHGCEEIAVDAMKLGAYDYANKGHISLDYIPVMIHTVYERAMLRKEAQLRQKELIEREKHQVAINTFRDTVGVLSEHIAQSLEELFRDAGKLRSADNPHMQAEVVADIEWQTKVIRAVAQSLENLNSVVNGTITTDEQFHEIKSNLEKTLESYREDRGSR